MTFKPSIWRPIAVLVSVGNLVGGAFAVGSGQMGHAAVHAVLMVAFGLWAQRMRDAPVESDVQDKLDELDAEMMKLRQELNDVQERLDFAERVLAKRPEAGRVGPQRQG